jgi:response regulator of citrate/malate metabolism
MKKVSMKKVSEVLRFHFKLELSIRQSANAANVSRSTASDYYNTPRKTNNFF